MTHEAKSLTQTRHVGGSTHGLNQFLIPYIIPLSGFLLFLTMSCLQNCLDFGLQDQSDHLSILTHRSLHMILTLHRSLSIYSSFKPVDIIYLYKSYRNKLTVRIVRIPYSFLTPSPTRRLEQRGSYVEVFSCRSRVTLEHVHQSNIPLATDTMGRVCVVVCWYRIQIDFRIIIFLGNNWSWDTMHILLYIFFISALLGLK